jgi:hypothetical protein
MWLMSLVVALFGIGLFQLQSAFTNVGQEFGAYGQYNRVLRVVRDMDDYTIVGHRVRRKLELAHLFHVEEFGVRLRDKVGRVAEISFAKGSDEMKEKDDAILQTIIGDKFQQALGHSASPKLANKAPEPTPGSVTPRATDSKSK